MQVVLRAGVGDRAEAVAVGRGAVWVATEALPKRVEGRLIRLDVRTGRRRASIPVGWWPSSVVVGAGGVWVADSIGDGWRAKNHWPGLQSAVTRIDPSTNRVVATIKLPLVESLAVAGGAVWATSFFGDVELVHRIDPKSDRVVATIRLPGVSGPLAAGGGKIWALTWFADPSERARISEIDPSSNRVVGAVMVPHAGPLSSVVYTPRVLWVSTVNPGTSPALRGRIVRIDLRDKRQLGPALLVPGATLITSNQVGIWAAGNGSMVGLDIRTGATIRRLKLHADVGSTSENIASAARSVWLVAGSAALATSSG